MARCELTGKGPKAEHLVSHSNIKTNIFTMPNVQKKRIFSQALGRFIRLSVSTAALRNMEHSGGFDTYLLRQCDCCLSPRARKIKIQIKSLMRKGARRETKN